VAWFGGQSEGADDVAIWCARRGSGGGAASSWSTPSVVVKQSDEAHWNPVLFWVGAVLHLHFKVGNDIDAWRTYRATSLDEGGTWSTARELVPGDTGGRGCVKNKPLTLPPRPPADGDTGRGGDGGENTGGVVGDGVQDGGFAAVVLCGASTERGGWRAFVDVSTAGSPAHCPHAPG